MASSGTHTFPVLRFDKLDSTNRFALTQAEKGAPSGTTVAAVQQTGGRGRLGRDFSSPPGGLYFSIILRPEIHSDRLGLLSLSAGLACTRVIEEVSGCSLMLKWPNDLYLENRKLGGILCESAAYSVREGRTPFFVAGIGINVNTPLERFDPDLRDRVISLFSLQKREYDLEYIMLRITENIMRYVKDPESGQQEIIAAWSKRDYLRGRRLRWHGPAALPVTGVGAGLLPDGRYLLCTENHGDVPVLGGTLTIFLDTQERSG
jgi:BirA family biotin operon repressor/biotin-[acetyl-CoA-carboxylase] ligase